MRKSNLDENNEIMDQTTNSVEPEVIQPSNVESTDTATTSTVETQSNDVDSAHDEHNDNKVDKFGDIEEENSDRPKAKRSMNPKVKAILEWVYCIVIAVVIAILIKFFVGTPTVVQQESMYPTLKPGDRLILNRICRTFHQEYEKGDIITFTAPSNDSVQQVSIDQNNPVAKYEEEPENPFEAFKYYVLEIGKTSFIKRIVATAGDHVVIKEGKVYVNGHQLIEDYLPEGTETYSDNYNDFVVPDGYVFAMGDNRAVSLDCRAFGCVPIDKIESKVVLRFFPFDKFGGVE